MTRVVRRLLTFPLMLVRRVIGIGGRVELEGEIEHRGRYRSFVDGSGNPHVELLDENGNRRWGVAENGAMWVGFDFLMARTTDGDFAWKRALVVWPDTLELNCCNDFAAGIRINGPARIVGDLRVEAGPFYPPVMLSADYINPSDVRQTRLRIAPGDTGDWAAPSPGDWWICWSGENRRTGSAARYQLSWTIDGNTSNTFNMGGCVCLGFHATSDLTISFTNAFLTTDLVIRLTAVRLR